MGIRPATVVSAGRGLCCDGLDADFPVPQGIAAWDVIRFTIPDGIVGCFIPVAVQIGAYVSNLATISIDPTGTFLLAENQGSDSIVVLRIDPQTGALSDTGHKIEVGSPVCVRMVPVAK